MHTRFKVFLPDKHTKAEIGFFRLYFGGLVGIPFHNDNYFSFTSELTDADVVAVSGSYNLTKFSTTQLRRRFLHYRKSKNKFSSSQVILDISHLYHVQEHYSSAHNLLQLSDIYEQFANFDSQNPQVKILHTNAKLKHNPGNLVYIDFLWNLVQELYIKRPHSLYSMTDINNLHWFPITDHNMISQKAYVLNDLSVTLQKESFIGQGSSNSTLTCAKDYYRNTLATTLAKYPGYISNAPSNNYLLGQLDGINDNRKITDVNSNAVRHNNGHWHPIHNTYYDQSVISIYVESVVHSADVSCITEKTWDSLIRGHFILPFGYHNIVQELVNDYNVLLPDWIDYSYDSISDDDLRWSAYLSEVERVVQLGTEQLYNHKVSSRGQEIIHHNRNIFYTDTYYKITPQRLGLIQ